MSGPAVIVSREGAVGRLTMDRPERRNAFDEALVADLHAGLRDLDADPTVRVVVLAAAGTAFSAGADLAWMRRMADAPAAEGEADALRVASLFQTLDRLSTPTLALVGGAARGGGVGLAAACDVVVASEGATFALTEVRLGLLPAVIAPYMVRAIGERAARRYALTAETFGAEEAARLGLAHRVVPAAHLEAEGARLCAEIARGAPGALADAKRLLRVVAEAPLDDALVAETARRIAAARTSPEGREGIAAFLERRRPAWDPE